MPNVDITENYIRLRQADPNLFEEGSFKTIRLTGGIKAIIGKKKGEKSTSIQSLLFDKNKFTTEKAKAWVAKYEGKFNDALDKENEKINMFSEEETMKINENLVTFSDEKAINKLKEIVEKIMSCSTLEEAKNYVSDLKALIPIEEKKEEEIKNEENKDSTPEEKTVEHKSQEEVLNEVKPVVNDTGNTPMKDDGNKILAETLSLNDKLILSLKDASVQIEALEKINTQLKEEIVGYEKELETFKETEKNKKMEAFNKKLSAVAEKWVTTFGIKEEKEKLTVVKMLSDFNSVDKLDEIDNYLTLKTENTRKKINPVIMTTPSEYLKTTEFKTNDSFVRRTEYEKMNSKEKTDYLFDKLSKLY